MRALTVSFDLASDDYSRLLDVFVNSWKANATIPLNIHRIKPPNIGERNYPYIANTRKLEVWRENFTEDTIFVDCDMLCLSCPSEGFESVENIGICERETIAPFNGGVIYAKYTDYSKRYFDELIEVNQRMLEDTSFHKKWQKKYAGINQSAMGYLFENGWEYTLVDKRFNLCEPWPEWEYASLIHIKGSKLRRICVHDSKTGEAYLQDIKEKWKSYAESSTENNA